MRRGFRVWLTESLAAPDNETVTDFALLVFETPQVPLVWRDDIAVAVLQSENAADFIRRAETSAG